MKFLIVGLGSMGKRRIRNLQNLNENNIIGFDLNQERNNDAQKKYGIEIFSEIDDAIKQKPEVMIISTPPDLHMKYANIAIENQINFFTEASVLIDGMENMQEKLLKTDIIGVPSSTMQFHPIVKKIKILLKKEDLGSTLSFIHHTGQYLPDWHPWEDYRKFYAAKRDTGAAREIVAYDLVWLTYLFGDIKKAVGIKNKISSLEIDIDDIYQSVLEFQNNIQGSLTVDVISRIPFIEIKILTEKGIILADWIAGTLKYYTKNTGWKSIEIDSGEKQGSIRPEEMYKDEMSTFLKSVKKEIDIPYSFKDDIKILKTLKAIEDSEKTFIS